MRQTEKNAIQGDTVRYFAAPGAASGTWAVIAQRHSNDPGYAVLGGLPNKETAEVEADWLIRPC